MVWSNYYLIPILLVGGLLAYMFGATVIGGVLRSVGRRFAHAPAQPAAVSFQPSMQAPPQVIYRDRERDPEPISRRKTLAERQAEWDARALTLADQREAESERLRALDIEEARIAALREENRKASKSTNVLVGKLQADPSAGPLTQAIQYGDALQQILRSAAASRDATAPK